MFGILVDFFKDHPYLLAAMILLTLSVSIQDTIIPVMVERLIQTIGATGSWTATTLRNAVMLLVATAVVQTVRYLDDYAWTLFAPRLFGFVRKRLVQCLFSQNQHMMHGDIDTGDVVTRFLRVPYMFIDFTSLCVDIAPHIVAVVVTCFFVWVRYDWAIAIVLAVMAIVVSASIAAKARSCLVKSLIRDEAMVSSQSHVDDVARNMTAIMNANNVSYEQTRIASLDDCQYKHYRSMMLCNVTARATFVVSSFVVMTVILWRCYKLSMTSAKFASLFVMTSFIMATYSKLLSGSSSLIQMWGGFHSSGVPYLVCDEHGRGGPGAGAPGAPTRQAQASQQTAAIVSGSRVTLPPMLPIEVTFEVRRGEKLAITGPMGVGKSTLLRVMVGSLLPADGAMFLDGQAYMDLSADAIRETFAYVPQNAVLFDSTVYENIVYGVNEPSMRTHEAILQASKTLGLDKVLYRDLAEGVATRVGRSGSRLSGGQRQAVWLMRAWLTGRRILVLDEPTSNMDAMHSTKVANAIKKFETVVFVSHDEDFVRRVATRRLKIA